MRRMFSDGHLSLREVALPPGGEWRFGGAGCGFVHVGAGVGYWLAKIFQRELEAGDVVVCTAGGGLFRASEIGVARLQVFQVEPAKLDELLTPAEIQQLESRFTDATAPLRIVTRAEPLAADYKQMLSAPEAGARELVQRGQMLQLAAACFAGFLPPERGAIRPGASVREKFHEVVGRLARRKLRESRRWIWPNGAGAAPGIFTGCFKSSLASRSARGRRSSACKRPGTCSP